MANITIEGIASLLSEELKPINTRLNTIDTRLESIDKTLNQHTSALDQLLTAKKNIDDEQTVSVERFVRLEHWAQQVGKKLGIELEL